jgi:peptidoglycan/LPS O-acetylase OafA/YrhL
MIQRKQTIYLFFCIICFIICAVAPLGSLIPDGMGVASTVNSIGIVDGDTGALSYPYFGIPMFFLALNVFWSLAIIFMYKNRKTQALNCYIQLAAILVETIATCALVYYTSIDAKELSFRPGFALCTPIIAMIFLLLAHKGIMDDERLVRAADRIR